MKATARAAFAAASILCAQPFTVAAVAATVPISGEFQVNTATSGHQDGGVTSYDPSTGDFVIVWLSEDRARPGIFGQRFDRLGARIGAEFQVTDAGSLPAISHDATGDFVVTWTALVGDAFPGFARRFDRNAIPLGDPIAVTARTAAFDMPISHHLASGEFVVVWNVLNPDQLDVKARRFARDGTALGPEFLVNERSGGTQFAPAVTHDSAGEFVVAYATSKGGGAARRFSRFGVPIGGEFHVAPKIPDVSHAPFSNEILVAWDDDAGNIFARRFERTGEPVGAEIPVSTFATGSYGEGGLAHDPATGGFTVAWTSGGGDGSGNAVFARSFKPDGEPLSDEFRVNVFTMDDQGFPRVSYQPISGRFVIVWQSDGQDGSLSGVFAREFGLTCAGEVVTIAGTYGDDVIDGTPAGDVIDGLTGHDEIRSMAGNDVVCGSKGRDRLLGGGGDDLLRGGKSNDAIDGGLGEDVLDGGSGDDTCTDPSALTVAEDCE